jgi:hypothetical protein
MPDYIPNTDGDLLIFLRNWKAKVASRQKDLSLTDAQVKSAQDGADRLIGSIEKNEQKRSEYLAQTAATRAVKEVEIPAVRTLARLIKALPGYSEAIGADLGIVASSASGVTGQDVEAECQAEAHKGFVRVKFKKGKSDGVNVYCMIQGEAGWRFLARDTNSPYDDHTPLRQAGTPETRLYRVIFVHKDEEIGTPSPAITVHFPG